MLTSNILYLCSYLFQTINAISLKEIEQFTTKTEVCSRPNWKQRKSIRLGAKTSLESIYAVNRPGIVQWVQQMGRGDNIPAESESRECRESGLGSIRRLRYCSLI